MNSNRPIDNVSLQQDLKIHAICLRFEKQCQAGEKPSIEQYLAETEQPARAKLLRELLLIELEQKSQPGDIAREQYEARFPELRQTIDEVFRTYSRHPDSRFTEKPGDTIGPYKLLQQIGEGGMGVVYMADQIEPVERRIALKIIKPGMDTKQVIARFEAERQALAMMDHPNIAKVLDAGTTESGRPYFVMELVRGIPITAYCDQAQLATRERLDLFIKVCRAIQHAHQKGIIHRDLKPENVAIDNFGQVIVIDWGLAKVLDDGLGVDSFSDMRVVEGESGGRTVAGQVLGTPLYMAPEQAAGRIDDIDETTDIYGLGATLYHAISGRPPFLMEDAGTANISWEALPHLVVEQRRPLSELRPDYPPEVEALVDRLMDRDPAARPTPGAVASVLHALGIQLFPRAFSLRSDSSGQTTERIEVPDNMFETHHD